VSREQLLGQFDRDERVVVADMEAGAGTLTRLPRGSLDMALLVVEPSAKSIDEARRASAIITERQIGLCLIVANRVRETADVDLIRASFPGLEIAVVPEDASVSRSDREAPSGIDIAPDGPAGQAIAELAVRLNRWNAPALQQDFVPILQ
jgi:CO dehydrogenase nickel-insertion accessory protein CooC1